ncbi:MAG: M6 family metalloprotease domain-containing protein [Bacteroidaceae bacterium]|nr:M6 family metalloprotease domain-containing protein [Bacteroidaceae bacterium]
MPGQRRVLELADGSTVTALLVGDEFGHYWYGENGIAYVSEGDAFIPVDVNSFNAKSRARRNASNRNREARLAMTRGVSDGVSGISGQKKGLIILVNFQDVQFKAGHDKDLYQKVANEKNYTEGKYKGSVYDYFYDQSEGQFELTFDVVGPVTLSNDVAYYGKNIDNHDIRAAEMVIEALHMVDSIVNFADYDWDGDFYVDQVYVLYAGKGEANGGATKTIWPQEWDLYSAKEEYNDGSGPQVLDARIVNTYACSCELNGAGGLDGIGTICHEFSHCLGFPDAYDIDYSGGQGMFIWDIMSDGSYNGSGFQPTGYTSFERWAAGWKTPIELSATTNVNGMKALQDGGDAYVIYNKGNRDEFFLLENRQKTGWDEKLPGAGLLILHIDYDQSVWISNQPNDDPEHQRMTWIPADNEYQYVMYNNQKYFTESGAANDPFPYDSINAFSATTTPAARFYNMNFDGTYNLDASIENITQNADGTISFYFRSLATGISDIGLDTNDTWYDLNGRSLPGAPSVKGIYLHNGKKHLKTE